MYIYKCVHLCVCVGVCVSGTGIRYAVGSWYFIPLLYSFHGATLSFSPFTLWQWLAFLTVVKRVFTRMEKIKPVDRIFIHITYFYRWL